MKVDEHKIFAIELDKVELSILVTLLRNALVYYPEDLDCCESCETKSSLLYDRLQIIVDGKQ